MDLHSVHVVTGAVAFSGFYEVPITLAHRHPGFCAPLSLGTRCEYLCGLPATRLAMSPLHRKLLPVLGDDVRGDGRFTQSGARSEVDQVAKAERGLSLAQRDEARRGASLPGGLARPGGG